MDLGADQERNSRDFETVPGSLRAGAQRDGGDERRPHARARDVAACGSSVVGRRDFTELAAAAAWRGPDGGGAFPVPRPAQSGDLWRVAWARRRGCGGVTA